MATSRWVGVESSICSLFASLLDATSDCHSAVGGISATSCLKQSMSHVADQLSCDAVVFAVSGAIHKTRPPATNALHGRHCNLCKSVKRICFEQQRMVKYPHQLFRRQYWIATSSAPSSAITQAIRMRHMVELLSAIVISSNIRATVDLLRCGKSVDP